jgi:hypothetical protein
MVERSPTPHFWTICPTVTTVIILIIALVAPYWLGWSSFKNLEISQKTYEQQWPAFETVGRTLQDKFCQPPTLSCKNAILDHPMEGSIEFWLNYSWSDTDSLNLLFYGEAMLGKVSYRIVSL